MRAADRRTVRYGSFTATGIVTGADNGIGRATARLFAREGARVVCMDVRESGKLRIDRLIAEEKGEAASVQGDVSNGDDVRRQDSQTTPSLSPNRKTPPRPAALSKQVG